VLSVLGLAGKQTTGALETVGDRWQAAVQVALEHEEDYLIRLFTMVKAGLTPRRYKDLDEALSAAGAAYVRRLLGAEHPEVGSQVDTLAEARSYDDIRSATGGLRRVALDARRMLMDPQLGTELGLQVSALDAERRRLELADLAIEVVAASDYLLNLVGELPVTEDHAYSAERSHRNRRHDPASNTPDWDDARYPRVVDAKADLLRIGGRLLLFLRRDSASPSSSLPM